MIPNVKAIGGKGRSRIQDPNEIATLIGWWRPESMNESGGNLTSWTDLSGNGRTLSPQGGSPAINSAGAPGGVLDAVDINCQSVNGNQALEITATNLNIVDYHLYLVMKITSWTGQGASGFLFYGDNTGGNSSKAPIFVTGSSGYLQNRSYDTGAKQAQWSSSVDPAAGSWALIEAFIEDGSEMGINVDDGTEVTTAIGSISSTGDVDSFTVSNSGANNEGYDTEFAEIIMYNARQASASAARVATLNYLVSRYGSIGSW